MDGFHRAKSRVYRKVEPTDTKPDKISFASIRAGVTTGVLIFALLAIGGYFIYEKFDTSNRNVTTQASRALPPTQWR